MLRANYPIVFHSIGFNIGGTQAFDLNYLSQFKTLYSKFKPELISDHLCWSAHEGNYHHDLLPIPRTSQSLTHVCDRIDFLQNYFERTMAVENITSYIDFKQTDIPEEDFITEIIKKTGCLLLLDITNLMINSKNKKFNPNSFLKKIPFDSIAYIHIAGGTQRGEIVIDTHGEAVPQSDLDLLKNVLNKRIDIPVLLERDANIPVFSELEYERSSIEGFLKDEL